MSAAAPVWVPVSFVLLWSTGFIGAKLGLPSAEPMTFLSLRFALVLALLLPACVLLRAAWPASRAEFVHAAVAGVLMQAVYLGGVFASLHLGMPAGVSSLIVGMQPVLTAALAAPLLGERVRPRQWAGLALGFAGLVLVVWSKVTLTGLGAASIALSLLALAGITFGTVYQKRTCARIDLRTLTAIQFVAALAVMLPLAFVFERREVAWTGEFVFALGWLVLVLSFGATFLLFTLIRRGAATHVASLMYLVPPCTAAIAWFVFDERFSPGAAAGMGLAVVGVWLVTRDGGAKA